ncbi:MAG: hypothetical protein KDA89_25070 [Planctomycetaceae bacterium]|nr:hypothetical protein [Planctomycetaceae bacterium]
MSTYLKMIEEAKKAAAASQYGDGSSHHGEWTVHVTEVRNPNSLKRHYRQQWVCGGKNSTKAAAKEALS